MYPILAKTFGGLLAAYYFRNFFFGMLNAGSRPLGAPVLLVVVFAINTLLYPYSRFVYEGVIGFFIGDNVFIVSGLFMLIVKFMIMALCWSAALFVAPIGLLYLYFHHSRAA